MYKTEVVHTHVYKGNIFLAVLNKLHCSVNLISQELHYQIQLLKYTKFLC